MILLGQSPSLDTQEQEYARMASEELRRVSHLTRQSLAFYRETVAMSAKTVAEMRFNAILRRMLQAKPLSRSEISAKLWARRKARSTEK